MPLKTVLEKLTLSQLLKKPPALKKTLKSITLYTNSRYCLNVLSQINLIHNPHITFKTILILSSNLHLLLPSSNSVLKHLMTVGMSVD
jgi:hypothetical protein